jgi:hypothetical protein
MLMLAILLAATIAARLGPMGPDAPAREPQLAASATTVALTFGAAKTIYVSISHDGGTTFSAPRKVADAPILPLSRHRGPHIALSGSTIVITAVTGSKPVEGPHGHGLAEDGNLLAWRSTDGGTTWSKGVPINDVSGSAAEGLHALASNGRGSYFAAWLDKRDARGTRLFAATSTDGGLTWSPNTLVYASPDGTICQCCHPSVAIAADGRFLVMWRNVLNDARDMYIAESLDGRQFSAPVKLGSDTWLLDGCPMDGGGLATNDGRVVTAWRRNGDLFADEPGQPEQRLGEGKDVALTLSGKRVYAIWTSGSGIQLWGNGRASVLSGQGAFPTLCPLAGGALAAWEENGAIEIRRLF